jgi:DNA-binding MarR family transcriptional regulator
MPKQTPREIRSGEALDHYRKHNVAWLLLRARQDFFRRASKGWKKRGYKLQNSFGTVITHLPLDGARLTELADSAGLTKQAMGQLVDELERLGYTERVSDPTDGRAKMVRFTRKGLKLVHDGRDVVSEVWAQYEELVGAKRLTRIRDDLDILVNSIEADEDAEAEAEAAV